MPCPSFRTRRALRQGTEVDLEFDNMTVFYRAFLRALARDAGDVSSSCFRMLA
jgi:hypothetical protein